MQNACTIINEWVNLLCRMCKVGPLGLFNHNGDYFVKYACADNSSPIYTKQKDINGECPEEAINK